VERRCAIGKWGAYDPVGERPSERVSPKSSRGGLLRRSGGTVEGFIPDAERIGRALGPNAIIG